MPQRQNNGLSGDARFNVKKPQLMLSNPFVNTYTLHPQALDLRQEPDSSLWWKEENHPREFPTMPGALETAEGCLDAFFRLYDASDEQIFKFAKRWGILGIYPVRREEPNPGFVEDGILPETRKRRLRQLGHSPNSGNPPNWVWTTEGTKLWRRLAKHFRALLLVAANLHGQENGKQEDWAEIIHDPQFAWAEWGAKARAGIDPANLKSEMGEWEPAARHNGKTFEQAFRDEQWAALRYALSRWTAQVPLYLKMGDMSGGNGVVGIDSNTMPTNWDVDMYDECVNRKLFDQPFTSDMTYWRQEPYQPMRSSALLNILVVQLIGAVTSSLFVCRFCQEPFKPEHGSQRLCSDGCKVAQGMTYVHAFRQRAKKSPARKPQGK